MTTHKLLATACLLACTITPPAFAADHAHHAHWSYSGETGPAKWSELDAANTACKLGKEQSPIDIKTASPAELPAIGFNYAAGPTEVVNNGHTIQINLSAAGSIKLASGDYNLLQFHFHTPSEEKIKGKAYPLVAHLVHRNAEGQLAVVAVLFKQGKENAALKEIFADLPAKEGDKKSLNAPFNPADLLPATQSYYRFMGSLTTPPCSEGVRWQVLKQPVEISAAQLAAFKKLYKMNARPVQALNGRTVEGN